MAIPDIDPCAHCEHFVPLQTSAPSPKPTLETPLARLRALLPGVVRRIAPGQHISLEGDASGQVIGVISGLVRCFRLTADGRRHICRFAGPQTIIGLGLLGVQRHSAEAITPSQVVVFRASAIDAAIERNSVVRGAILQALAEELTERERIQLRLGRLNADQRVADFLLEITAIGARKTDSNDIAMSRSDIADHLGVTLETVSRALHRFDRMKLIELSDSHHFRLLSDAGLHRFIDGDDEPTYLHSA